MSDSSSLQKKLLDFIESTNEAAKHNPFTHIFAQELSFFSLNPQAFQVPLGSHTAKKMNLPLGKYGKLLFLIHNQLIHHAKPPVSKYPLHKKLLEKEKQEAIHTRQSAEKQLSEHEFIHHFHHTQHVSSSPIQQKTVVIPPLNASTSQLLSYLWLLGFIGSQDQEYLLQDLKHSCQSGDVVGFIEGLLKLTFHNNSDTKLIFQGELLSGAGENDIFIFSILARLFDSQIQYELLLSKNDFYYLEYIYRKKVGLVESYQSETQRMPPSTRSYFHWVDQHSDFFENMGFYDLSHTDPITTKELESFPGKVFFSIYRNCFLARTSLVIYDPESALLFSYADFSLDTLAKMYQYFNNHSPYSRAADYQHKQCLENDVAFLNESFHHVIQSLVNKKDNVHKKEDDANLQSMGIFASFFHSDSHIFQFAGDGEQTQGVQELPLPHNKQPLTGQNQSGKRDAMVTAVSQNFFTSQPMYGKVFGKTSTLMKNAQVEDLHETPQPLKVSMEKMMAALSDGPNEISFLVVIPKNQKQTR